ncbi:MAG: hypothetical protein RL722_1992 [Pseudomonadota bacterium]|jgi:predicted small lipoprotein YifL
MSLTLILFQRTGLAALGGASRALFAGLGLAVLLALAACGGGGPDEAAPASAAGTTLSGHIGSGALAQFPTEAVLRGRAGLPRRVDLSAPQRDYLLHLRALDPVYALRAQVSDPDTFEGETLYSLVSDGQDGTQHLTPLTTLLMAQLTVEDPATWFDAIALQGPLNFSPAEVAAAEEAVALFLHQRLGVAIPADERGWNRRSFELRAGDPHQDLLAALREAWVAQGQTLADLAAAQARQASLCRRHGLQLQGSGLNAGQPLQLCPDAATREPDPADPALDLLRWTSPDGQFELHLAGDGSTAALSFQDPAGQRWACSGAACGRLVGDAEGARLTLGTSQATAELRSDLDGNLLAASGSLILPPSAALPLALGEDCSGRAYHLNAPSGAVHAGCLQTNDATGEGGTLGNPRGRGARWSWFFQSRDGRSLIELVLDGERLASVVTVEDGQVLACVADACKGVTVGTLAAGPLGLGYQRRLIRLSGTVLQARLADGSTDPTQSLQLDGSFVALQAPGTVNATAYACADGDDAIQLVITGEAGGYAACPPAEADDPSARIMQLDEAGLVASVFVRSPEFQGLFLSYVAGQLERAVFDGGALGERFACGRQAAGEPACSGVSLSAPDDQGRRRLVVGPQDLVEVGVGEVVLDRRARVQGELLLAPDLPAVVP